MAEFLTTAGTIHHIEQIITQAKRTLVFITPYVQISKNVFERLQDASNRKVKITFVYGKGDLNPNEYENLKQISGLKLYYFDNLHAKCYHNEDRLIITSMNLYDHSAKNREMGILLSRQEDKSLFESAVQEAESIVSNAERKQFGLYGNIDFYTAERRSEPANRNFIKQMHVNENQGICIRCGTHITLDGSRPYCGACYSTWSQFSNPYYTERHCHGCGAPTDTSMEKPFCYSCYKKFG